MKTKMKMKRKNVHLKVLVSSAVFALAALAQLTAQFLA